MIDQAHHLGVDADGRRHGSRLWRGAIAPHEQRDHSYPSEAREMSAHRRLPFDNEGRSP
jgi:hypothetical protein